MKNRIGTVLLGLITLFDTAIYVLGPVMACCAALAGGIGLLLEGQWSLVLVGIAALSLGQQLIGGLLVPGALFAEVLRACGYRWRLMKPLPYWIMGLNHLVIGTLWALGSFYVVTHWPSHSDLSLVGLIAAYALAICPWLKWYQSQRRNFELSLYEKSYQIGCLVLLFGSRLAQLSAASSVVLIAGGMVLALGVYGLAVLVADKLCRRSLRREFIQAPIQLRKKKEAKWKEELEQELRTNLTPYYRSLLEPKPTIVGWTTSTL